MYVDSINITGYFNEWLPKKEEKLTEKKWLTTCKPVSRQKENALCLSSILTALANAAT